MPQASEEPARFYLDASRILQTTVQGNTYISTQAQTAQLNSLIEEKLSPEGGLLVHVQRKYELLAHFQDTYFIAMSLPPSSCRRPCRAPGSP
eukprot:6172251-Pleurochrysis_carterae.AAC.2